MQKLYGETKICDNKELQCEGGLNILSNEYPKLYKITKEDRSFILTFITKEGKQISLYTGYSRADKWLDLSEEERSERELWARKILSTYDVLPQWLPYYRQKRNHLAYLRLREMEKEIAETYNIKPLSRQAIDKTNPWGSYESTQNGKGKWYAGKKRKDRRNKKKKRKIRKEETNLPTFVYCELWNMWFNESDYMYYASCDKGDPKGCRHCRFGKISEPDKKEETW